MRIKGRTPYVTIAGSTGRAGAGTIYVIAVSGDKFVEQASRDYVEVGRSGISTYQTIEIDTGSNRLSYRARTEDGTVVDAFSLEKPRQPKAQNENDLSGPLPTIAPTLTRAVLAPRSP